jgi:hypothetical protein
MLGRIEVRDSVPCWGAVFEAAGATALLAELTILFSEFILFTYDRYLKIKKRAF